jgi:regulator of sigma D
MTTPENNIKRLAKDFAEYLNDAIKHNFLLVILITSQTQGKRKSENLPFGLGKTTLMLWLMYYINGGTTETAHDPTNKVWDIVFQKLCGNPYDVAMLLEPGSKRTNAAGWDAVQMTAPAAQGVPKVIRDLSSYVSDTRPELACLIMTASNMNAISAPLRKLVVFEIIIAERGEYEIQKIKYSKNFEQPMQDLCRLDYIEEGSFPALPSPVMARYEEWRKGSKRKIYPKLKAECESYMKLQNEQIDPQTITGSVIKIGNSGYAVKLPREVGEKYHRQLLQLNVENPSEQTPTDV